MTEREASLPAGCLDGPASGRPAASNATGSLHAVPSFVGPTTLLDRPDRRAENARTSGRARGFTLFEILVVILLIGLLAALVAPAIRLAFEEDRSEIEELIRGGRELAASRAETVYLRVAATGEWRVEGASEPNAPVAEGTLEDVSLPSFTLVFSPLGTCSLDVRSTAVARRLPIEPLTCRPQLEAEEAG